MAKLSTWEDSSWENWFRTHKRIKWQRQPGSQCTLWKPLSCPKNGIHIALIMLHIRSSLKRFCWQSWLRAFRLLHPWVNLGSGLKLYGLPVFVFPKSAHVRIADGIVFRSSVRQNFVGLFKKCTIYVQSGAELTILDHSGFSGVSIYCAKEIRIGKYVNCGGNVCIWDTDFHPLEYQARRQNVVELIKASPIIIGDDVFIGANSIILKGVTIGNRSIIGAGSVVTSDVPPDEVWAGNPARFLKRLEHSWGRSLRILLALFPGAGKLASDSQLNTQVMGY